MEDMKVLHSTPFFVSRVEKLTTKQQELIRKTGFGNLLFLPKHNLSKTLLAHLIENWNCESLAFQLAGMEISPTPLDVALILGLPISGQPVILDEDAPYSDLEALYEVDHATRKIACKYLGERLDSLGDADNDDFTRTFLLFAFASFLFRSSNGDLDSRYLTLLHDLDRVPQYAWGLAVLEHLTTWVSNRKKNRMTYVGGCLAFLQIWFFEHVDMARPALQRDSRTFPRACRWEQTKSHKYPFIQTEFKNLGKEQIIRELQPTAVELEFLAVRTDVAQEIVCPARMDEPQTTVQQDDEVRVQSEEERRVVAYRRMAGRLLSAFDDMIYKLDKKD